MVHVKVNWIFLLFCRFILSISYWHSIWWWRLWRPLSIYSTQYTNNNNKNDPTKPVFLLLFFLYVKACKLFTCFSHCFKVYFAQWSKCGSNMIVCRLNENWKEWTKWWKAKTFFPPLFISLSFHSVYLFIYLLLKKIHNERMEKKCTINEIYQSLWKEKTIALEQTKYWK